MSSILQPSITVSKNLASSIRNFIKARGGKNVSETQMNTILQKVAKFDAERDSGARAGGSIFDGGSKYKFLSSDMDAGLKDLLDKVNSQSSKAFVYNQDGDIVFYSDLTCTYDEFGEKEYHFRNANNEIISLEDAIKLFKDNNIQKIEMQKDYDIDYHKENCTLNNVIKH